MFGTALILRAITNNIIVGYWIATERQVTCPVNFLTFRQTLSLVLHRWPAHSKGRQMREEEKAENKTVFPESTRSSAQKDFCGWGANCHLLFSFGGKVWHGTTGRSLWRVRYLWPAWNNFVCCNSSRLAIKWDWHGFIRLRNFLLSLIIFSFKGAPFYFKFSFNILMYCDNFYFYSVLLIPYCYLFLPWNTKGCPATCFYAKHSFLLHGRNSPWPLLLWFTCRNNVWVIKWSQNVIFGWAITITETVLWVLIIV